MPLPELMHCSIVSLPQAPSQALGEPRSGLVKRPRGALSIVCSPNDLDANYRHVLPVKGLGRGGRSFQFGRTSILSPRLPQLGAHHAAPEACTSVLGRGVMQECPQPIRERGAFETCEHGAVCSRPALIAISSWTTAQNPWIMQSR